MAMGGSSVAHGWHHRQPAEQLRVMYALHLFHSMPLLFTPPLSSVHLQNLCPWGRPLVLKHHSTDGPCLQRNICV